MAKPHTLYLRHAQLPDQATLQNAINTLKFKLVVEVEYAGLVASIPNNAYLPCVIVGEDGGVTARLQTLPRPLAELPQIEAALGDRDISIKLGSGGDPREDACMFILAAVFASSFDAVVQMGDKDEVLSAEALSKKAKSSVAELD